VSGLLALMREARATSRRAAGPFAAELAVGAGGRIDACTSLARAGAGCACDCAAAAPLAATIAPR
ncbi:MAG: hypothetical protein JO090_03495, partial [Rhizobacter sp.]|nr:hypothetical protein [Rhizobacter sp.]